MRKHLVIHIICLIILSVDLQAQGFSGKNFATLQAFRDDLLKNEVSTSQEGLYLTTLYDVAPGIKILKAEDTGAGMMGGSWPVFFVWERAGGIAEVQIDWFPQTSRVVHGEMKVYDVSLIESMGKKLYVLYVQKTLQERSEMETEETETVCKAREWIYPVIVDEEEGEVYSPIKSPIPLGEQHLCNEPKKHALNIIGEEKSLIISGEEGSCPEAYAWVGRYRLKQHELVRSDSADYLRSRLKSADKAAIEFFKKGKVKRAISILTPLLRYTPDLLDERSVAMYNNYAYFLLEDHQYTKALPILEEIVLRFPKRTVAHLNLADTYYALREHEKAKKHYRIYRHQIEEKSTKKSLPERVLERSR